MNPKPATNKLSYVEVVPRNFYKKRPVVFRIEFTVTLLSSLMSKSIKILMCSVLFIGITITTQETIQEMHGYGQNLCFSFPEIKQDKGKYFFSIKNA
jgi:hypothetical protein